MVSVSISVIFAIIFMLRDLKRWSGEQLSKTLLQLLTHISLTAQKTFLTKNVWNLFHKFLLALKGFCQYNFLICCHRHGKLVSRVGLGRLGKWGRNEVERIAPRSPGSLNRDRDFWHQFYSILFQHNCSFLTNLREKLHHSFSFLTHLWEQLHKTMIPEPCKSKRSLWIQKYLYRANILCAPFPRPFRKSVNFQFKGARTSLSFAAGCNCKPLCFKQFPPRIRILIQSLPQRFHPVESIKANVNYSLRLFPPIPIVPNWNLPPISISFPFLHCNICWLGDWATIPPRLC